MDIELFGGMTVEDLLPYAIGVVVLYLALKLIRPLFSGSKEDNITQKARCPSCNWVGTVSRVAGRCPKCNMALGDNRAHH
jgi:hypothetical protein